MSLGPHRKEGQCSGKHVEGRPYEVQLGRTPHGRCPCQEREAWQDGETEACGDTGDGRPQREEADLGVNGAQAWEPQGPPDAGKESSEGPAHTLRGSWAPDCERTTFSCCSSCGSLCGPTDALLLQNRPGRGLNDIKEPPFSPGVPPPY